MAKKPRDPFDVKLDDTEREKLAVWLCDEIQAARDARAVTERECDYWHIIYEQGRTRQAGAAPWPGAADLTSYLGTQNVDALHARLMKTVNVEPVWNVEGWAGAAQNAPFVEEFHQWKQEEERLQATLDKLGLISLIEPRGLLEVSESTETRRVRKQQWVRLQMQPHPVTGEMGPVFNEDATPALMMDPQGKYVEATAEVDPMTGQPIPAVEVVVDSVEPVRTGPQMRVIPYRDSLIFPGHARDKEEIWGYGKRIYKRMSDIREMAKKGVYDQDAVDRLTVVSDREPDLSLQRSGQSIAQQERDTVEKELWEVTLLKDLDGKGERWYVCTVNPGNQLLLRCQYDDLDRARYIPIILFPRPDRATEGFSFIGHKLITTIEEHTAWRNMIADRAQLIAQAPIKKMQGALWDELEQPFGAAAVITVRDMNEVQPFQIPDVPGSLMNREATMERTAERLAGVNDIAAGQTVQQGDKTLGEIQMATEQSFVRMDLVIRRFQEAMEDLFQIRHAIYKRMLAEHPEGIEMPESMMTGLEMRGMAVPGGRMTAQMLEGQFRGKPRGSVETADPRAMRSDFVQMMQAFPPFMQTVMMISQTFGPQAARAMLDQFVRVFRVQNRAAFVGGMAQPGMMGAPGMGMLPPGQMPMRPGMPPMVPGPAQAQ
jgi:hypothetical protein